MPYRIEEKNGRRIISASAMSPLALAANVAKTLNISVAVTEQQSNEEQLRGKNDM